MLLYVVLLNLQLVFGKMNCVERLIVFLHCIYWIFKKAVKLVSECASFLVVFFFLFFNSGVVTTVLGGLQHFRELPHSYSHHNSWFWASTLFAMIYAHQP